jgi:signal transduction histidine kinase
MKLMSASGQRQTHSLYQQIKRARFWLPVAIVGVVLVHQLAIVPLGGETWRFWSQLLFYSILGPIVTFITLNWIALEVRLREEAQASITSLYTELRDSHELLAAIQQVTEQFSAASDLEGMLSAAGRGVTEVTGAVGAALQLGPAGATLTDYWQLDEEQREDAIERATRISGGHPLLEQVTLGSAHYWVLYAAVSWAGSLKGSLQAYYRQPATSKQREAFSILLAQFSAATEASHGRMRDLLTLVDVDRSIRAEGNLERLLETLLSQMMNRVEATRGSVYLADEEGLLHLRASSGVPRFASAPPLRSGEGLIGTVTASAAPRIVNDAPASQLAEAGPVLQGAGSIIVLPLQADAALLGVLILASDQPGSFSSVNLPFLGLVAGQVSLGVRNARAYLQSEELAIAEERARIARDIHDGVAQSLAFSALKLDLVGRLLERDPQKAAAELLLTKNTIRETIREVRRSIFALRPVQLERHGFLGTLRRYLADYGEQNDIKVSLDVTGQQERRLSLKAETILFRIFQEAMNNVAKHSGASHVRVTVGTTSSGHAFVEIQDDGQGFDLAAISDRVTSAGGLGLQQMRERLRERGGSLEIDTAPGKGTRIRASLPG